MVGGQSFAITLFGTGSAEDANCGKVMKLLWGNAAARCSFAECRIRLTSESGGAYTIGEMAHIRGERSGSNRHDPLQDISDRNAYENLILLCPNHHTEIDKPENETIYSVERLTEIKLRHEEFVSGRLERDIIDSQHKLAIKIHPLLIENYQSWSSFGPQSELARTRPYSDAHAIWLDERLATIVPNNRKITNLLQANLRLLVGSDLELAHKFLLHARTYERWVLEDVSYEGVTPFPQEFERLIRGLAIAST